MKLIDITKLFHNEDSCLDYIENLRWPNNEIGCVHCGEIGKISKITRESKSKNKRMRLYQCGVCGKQFSATSGTIFHDSHLPLVKWFLAIAMICEAKKGISACQLQRNIGGSYRTSWHLAHRIREAMQEGSFQLAGAVEADTTHIQGRVKRRSWRERKPRSTDCVMGMIERSGKLKLVPVKDEKISILRPVLEQHISPDVETI